MALEPDDPLLRAAKPAKKAKKESKSSSVKNNDLETSDPLLDSMN